MVRVETRMMRDEYPSAVKVFFDFSDKRLEVSMGILQATWLAEKEKAFTKVLTV
jgi:hypothetical protein